jgi:hypothetical protein
MYKLNNEPRCLPYAQGYGVLRLHTTRFFGVTKEVLNNLRFCIVNSRT